jgi:hypothetical protein
MTVPNDAMTLIEEPQAARVRAHIHAMLSRLKARIEKPAQQAA